MRDKETVHIEITWKALLQIAVFAALILVLYFAKSAFSALLVAMVISIGIDPVISLLQKIKIGRVAGAIIFFLCIFALLALVGYAITPIIFNEITGFLQDINDVLTRLTGASIPESVISALSGSVKSALSLITPESISRVTGAIGTVVGNTIFFFAVLVITFYLSIQKEGTDQLLQVILPDAYERPVVTVFNRFKAKIRRWFAAQLGLSIAVGVLVSLGLWILGVKYFLILGVLAGILEIVPIVGPILASVITFLIAIGSSLTLGLYSLIFFVCVQQLENHILVPIIMGRTMNIHPVVVVISMLAGAQIAGFLGIVLAVPIAVVAQETFTYLSETRNSRRGML